MKPRNGWSMRSAAAYLAALVQLAVLGLLLARSTEAPPDYVGDLLRQVPRAKPALSFRGSGFAARGDSYHSTLAAEPQQLPTRTVEAAVPVQATGEFRVGALSAANRVKFKLPSASPSSQGRLERGAIIHEGVYDAVDLISVRDPERFEIAFVLRDLRKAPKLAFELEPTLAAAELRREADSGAVLVENAQGQPLLRIPRPVAFDAAGKRRLGDFEVAGDRVVLAMNYEGMTAPVVVDPAFYIPHWTLASDVRQPGALVYDRDLLSFETRVATNPMTGEAILIRPVRSQQDEDHSQRFGIPSEYTALRHVASELREPGSNGGPDLTQAELDDWQLSFRAASETYRWTGSAWSRSSVHGLPGLIDPGVTYSTGLGKFVVVGGVATETFNCGPSGLLYRCYLPNVGSPVFELEGDQWVEKRIVGGPKLRVRPALGEFDGRVMLFGGREVVRERSGYPWPSDDRWLPFPDSLAGEETALLNDTWLYDGTSWNRVPTSNPPPGTESAQMIYDSRRKRAVLVGGAPVDSFSIWEFDGLDWVRRFAVDDAALPEALRGRTGTAAFWHPGRGTTLLFGGMFQRLPSCARTDDDVDDMVAEATDETRASVLHLLRGEGCLPGYAHDIWEWDGEHLSLLSEVSLGGWVPNLDPLGREDNLAVFRQLSGSSPLQATSTVAGEAADGATPLLPWRYDPDTDHFRLRSTLERAHLPAGAPAAKQLTGESASGSVLPQVTQVSPSFAASVRPDVSFDPTSNRLRIFTRDDHQRLDDFPGAFETDGSSWTEFATAQTPFDRGQNDFFAVTWDSPNDRAIVFDPRTAQTWQWLSATDWAPMPLPEEPPPWDVYEGRRNERDLGRRTTELGVGDVEALTKIPRMTFDRVRGVAVMFHANTLWELRAEGWVDVGAPPSLAECEATTLLSYDGSRQRAVLVGCTVPAQTWEWDGAGWHGPFESPYTALIERGDPAYDQFNLHWYWQGTLQAPFAHDNAIVESQLLGGIATMDADGRLKVWDGEVWRDEASLGEMLDSDRVAEGYYSDFAEDILNGGSGLPTYRDATLRLNEEAFGYHYPLPMVFFPPLLEDAATQRLLAFRDGETGLRQLRTDVAQVDRAWEAVFLGEDQPLPSEGPISSGGPSRYAASITYPFPLELMSAERINMEMLSDPASHEPQPGGIPIEDYGSNGPPENTAFNLYWPFRLLRDFDTGRIRLLSHRGALWEFGNEVVGGLGDACESNVDCAAGICTAGVCCNTPCNDVCMTCNGANPGTCEPVAAGQPEPAGRCGSGQCAGFCPGDSAQCSWDSTRACGNPPSCQDGQLTSGDTCSATGPSCVASAGQTAPCDGGLACNDTQSCKTTCASRSDCVSNFEECHETSGSCVPDAVAAAAAGLGITPSEFVAPTPSLRDMADHLKTVGFQETPDGQIFLPGFAYGGIMPTFDPNIRTPITGLKFCAWAIRTCLAQTDDSVDACVAGAKRCVGSSPWQDEALGCCPVACLEHYMNERANGANEVESVASIHASGCYPGFSEYMHSGVEP